VERALLTLVLVAVIVFFGGPFLMVAASALDGARLTNWPWPSEPTLSNFRVLFNQRGAGHALRNSLIVSVATTLLAVPVCSLAGYGLSRMAFRGKTRLSVSVLLLQSIPLSATMVPIYDLASRLHLRNSYLGLILTHAAISLPLLVWLMKGFTDAAPRALEEAARVDGASTWDLFWKIHVPLARAPMASRGPLRIPTPQ